MANPIILTHVVNHWRSCAMPKCIALPKPTQPWNTILEHLTGRLLPETHFGESKYGRLQMVIAAMSETQMCPCYLLIEDHSIVPKRGSNCNVWLPIISNISLISIVNPLLVSAHLSPLPGRPFPSLPPFLNLYDKLLLIRTQ